MRVYFDSSALIKRVVEEPESDALEQAFDEYIADGAVIVSSSLAWIEVSRALRGRFVGGAHDIATTEAIESALSGVAERFITDDVIGLARRTGSAALRTLDAIHLASAILLDVNVVVAYDARLIDACRRNGLTVVTPGR